MYDYGYSSASSSIGAFFAMFQIITLVLCVLMIVAYWKLFTKASVEGWKAIIPFYNTYVMCQISGTGIIWFVLTFVPLVNIVASILITVRFLTSYEVPVGICVLGIFFPCIVLPIVAFSSKYQYIGVCQ